MAFDAAGCPSPPRDAPAQASTSSAERRLRNLGIVLSEVQTPVANYVPYARMGNLVFLPGVGPLQPDGTFATGKVGADLTVEEAVGRARLTGLVPLAAMREAAGGLDRVVRVGEVFGTVNAPPGFTEHPKAIAGATPARPRAWHPRRSTSPRESKRWSKWPDARARRPG